MSTGYRGRPGYFSRGNFRGNVRYPKNMAGAGMMSPYHNRYNYGQFADDVDSFVGGLEPKQVKWNKKKYNKNKNFPIPQKTLKQEEKAAATKEQPKTSGGAVNKPQQQQKINTNQPKPSEGAVNKPQQQQKLNTNQPKPSEDAAKNPQKTTKAFRKKARKLKRAAKKRQTKRAQDSVVNIPQQPKSPGASQPANPDAKQEKRTATQNGEAAGETRDAEVPTPPHKKMKMEEMTLPAELPSHGWRGDTSTMFSCSLCRYHTQDEREMQIHFYSSQHKDVLKHLYIFYPKQRVDFLNNYLLFKKRKMSMEQKKKNLQPVVNDKFKGIGQEHFFHRIQAAQCGACNVLIPDVPELLTTHIKSDDHQQNCKVTLKNIKVNSLAAAKELLLDKDILQMLKLYIAGRNPFKDTAVSSAQGGSAPEVLVAEEDDDNVEEDDDDHSDDDDINCEDGQGFSANKDSGPTMAVNTDVMVKEKEKEKEEEEEEDDDEEEEEEEEEAAEAP